VRYRIGMRWWLAAVFAVIAAVTAMAVGQLLSSRSEDAFRERAQQLAVGNAFEAAIEIRESRPPALDRVSVLEQFGVMVEGIAARRRLSLFVFDAEGNLLTGTRSRGVDLGSIGGRSEALRSALAGNRFVSTNEAVRATIVAFPPRDSTILVAYASHPDLGAGIGIVRREIVQAALWAILIGALAGILVAALIARRLRRIAAAAAAIEQGQFEIALRPRFRDEVGELASSIDSMRSRLQQSFGQLKAERDRREGLLERLHEGVLTVDRGLAIDFANSEAKRLLATPQLRPGDKLPEPWAGFSLRALARRLFTSTTSVVEERLAPEEDSTYLVVGIPAPVDSDTAVIVVTDVSARERRERAEREFVTNAAHELRTPLTTLTGAVEALQSGAKDVPAERDRFLAHIERESARLTRLVRALLVLARAQTHEEAPRLTPVSVPSLLEDVLAGLTPRAGVTVDVDCPPGLTVLAQRELATQAVANLAANAARFTEHGSIQIAARRVNGSVTIEVRDTGPGIPRRHRERLFDRFYRAGGRDADGFGLGLAIVREAVHALGGTVSIDSREGDGTNARITLAAAEADGR
jgi:signal transduction histidine kinase/HAMP domain-containing protein